MITRQMCIVLIALLGCTSLACAAPAVKVEKVALKDLAMAVDDAIQNKPFEFDSADTYFFWRGQFNPEPFALTDAAEKDAPTDEVMAQGNPKEVIMRWDLGSPSAKGRELKEIRVTWGNADSARAGIYLKFAAHDITTRQWRDITDYIREDAKETQADTAKVLTLTFPAKEVTNFDAIRLYDGRPQLKLNTTRFIEVDVFTTPNNR